MLGLLVERIISQRCSILGKLIGDEQKPLLHSRPRAYASLTRALAPGPCRRCSVRGTVEARAGRVADRSGGSPPYSTRQPRTHSPQAQSLPQARHQPKSGGQAL
jgi:hypothetical protein